MHDEPIDPFNGDPADPAAGLHDPREEDPLDPLTDVERQALGIPFVIKPSMGYGKRGLVMDATMESDMSRSIAAWPDENYLFQRKIVPRQLASGPAYFRVFYVFGSIFKLIAGSDGGMSLSSVLTSVMTAVVGTALSVVVPVFTAKLYLALDAAERDRAAQP